MSTFKVLPRAPRWRWVVLGAAVLALGTTATTAAFTDSASVTASVASGTLDITVNAAQGNPTPITVTLPLGLFKPGDTTSTTLQVKNTGSLPAVITTMVAGTGPAALGAQLDANLTATPPASGAVTASGKAISLALGVVTIQPGVTVPVVLTLTLPAATDNTWQGKTDTLTVTLNAAQA